MRNLHEEDVYSIGCTSSFYFADMAFYGIYVLSTALVLTVEQEEPRWAQVEENARRDDEPGGSWLKPVSKTTVVWLGPFRELARHCWQVSLLAVIDSGWGELQGRCLNQIIKSLAHVGGYPWGFDDSFAREAGRDDVLVDFNASSG